MNTMYFLNMIAGNTFGTQTTPAFPSRYYLGLSTTAPLESGVCNGEPSFSTGYRRVPLTSLSTPEDGVISNQGEINFQESVASWGEIKYYVVYDAANNGNLLFGEALTSPITVDAGTVITIKSGELRIRVVTPA